MKKIFEIFLLIFISITLSGAFGIPKQEKCEKPIYFFENVQKSTLFGFLDEALQEKNYELKKFYPELGFVSLIYEEEEIATFNMKQFGYDTYVFVDIPEKNSKLEKYVYEKLKKHTENSYKLKDDYLCRELTKDIKNINTRRKPSVEDENFNPFEYQFSLKRYVGYDRKTLEDPKIKYKKQEKEKQKKEKELKKKNKPKKIQRINL